MHTCWSVSGDLCWQMSFSCHSFFKKKKENTGCFQRARKYMRLREQRDWGKKQFLPSRTSLSTWRKSQGNAHTQSSGPCLAQDTRREEGTWAITKVNRQLIRPWVSRNSLEKACYRRQEALGGALRTGKGGREHRWLEKLWGAVKQIGKTSLVIQQLRICLAMQGTWLWSLGRELKIPHAM